MTQTTVTPTLNDSDASYVVRLGGVTDADGTVSLAVGRNVITVRVTAEDTTTTKTYIVAVTRAEPSSTDATLKALTLSGIDFGSFDSTTTSYTASVANSVSHTTVAPTLNDSDASYVIKIGGVTDADGTISLTVGVNIITIKVTAEDTTTTRTYTIAVTRAEPPSTDATLSALTLSGIDFGSFSSTTTSYTASVENSVSQTTVTPTVNDSGASYVIKLGGVTDSDGTVPLAVGSNVITVEVTAEDESTTRTYTVTITRSTTTSYTVSIPNGVSQTTVTATVNHSGASYIVKLGGVIDTDRRISLAVGSNVITIEVDSRRRQHDEDLHRYHNALSAALDGRHTQRPDIERGELRHIRAGYDFIHGPSSQLRVADYGYTDRKPFGRKLRHQGRRSDRRRRHSLAIRRQ